MFYGGFAVVAVVVAVVAVVVIIDGDYVAVLDDDGVWFPILIDRLIN